MVKGVYQAPHAIKINEPTVTTTNIQTLTEKHILSHFSPSSVVVDEAGAVFYIHGRTGSFLEPAQGKPNLNILTMAREGLKIDLSSALRKASHQNDPVSVEGIKVKNDGGSISVNLTVQKILEPEQLQGLFMVVFESQQIDVSKDLVKTKKDSIKSKSGSLEKAETLEKELQYTKETLQSTIEELETTNEELKSTNEELQSTNEELQSSNEEIETSKEEMQSLNEELQTTNAELQAKIEQYSMSNDDMQNLLNSTTIATLFLDNDLHIKRFTPAAQKIINLIPSDVGRPIGDIVSKLDYNELIDDCTAVNRTLVFKEKEVATKEGHWYRLRIFPYRTAENKIMGLVVTFIDINDLKYAEAELAKTGQLKLITDVLPVMIAYIDDNLKYQLANKSYQANYAFENKNIVGKPLKEVLGTPAFKLIEKQIYLALKGDKVAFETESFSPKGDKKKLTTQLIPHFENKKVVGFFMVTS